MASEVPTLTPMMAQYRRIKSELPADALLLFRLGDFYEMFFEDAQISAPILNVALTKRGSVPMCGIPFHAANGYLSKLLQAGRKVAICEQVEEAVPGQLVKREVTQILSPGTHFDERMLVAERNNYLAAICPFGKIYGLALVDLTTASFKVCELEGEAGLLAELERLRPAEILVPSEAASLTKLVQPFGLVSGHEDWVFAKETAQFTVREHFKVASLDGFGLRDRGAAVGAAGAILHYLSQHLRRDITHLQALSFYQSCDYLILDATTLRHLEVIEPLHRDASANTTLFGVLNRCQTPMGARRLRDWLSQPLSSIEAIERRQEVVATWIKNYRYLEPFRNQLKEVRDLERTLGRLTMGSGNARDLIVLRNALDQIPQIQETLSAVSRSPGVAEDLQESFLSEPTEPTHGSTLLEELARQLVYPEDLLQLIRTAIVEEPPIVIREGGLIREGFDPNLDELRQASTEGKNWIARLQQEEIERTGIPSLKIRFNSVFGYFLEVTKSHLEKVPAHYIRKQTVAGGERYITPELKEVEGKILGAEERSVKLEHEIFLRVRERVLERLAGLQAMATSLAQLDVLTTLAEVARLHNFVRPEIQNTGRLTIVDGRHPVLEQRVSEERFIPNDVDLSTQDQQVMIITGPNMAGKSTYIRQVALLTLLAHTGSFLPAKSAQVDLVDRIFTRIGASDDLARGQSTFMVEMSETANILHNASARSLVILDEIGRGTSTFDGLSLAWSIVEHLHNQVGAKTLFATHYHELTELAGRLPRLRNFNVAVREYNDQIIFLRRIVPGGADKSYGIQVARLAGVPKTIVDRAKEILRNLEESELTPEGSVRQSGGRHRAEREKLKTLQPAPQLDLFS